MCENIKNNNNNSREKMKNKKKNKEEESLTVMKISILPKEIMMYEIFPYLTALFLLSSVSMVSLDFFSYIRDFPSFWQNLCNIRNHDLFLSLFKKNVDLDTLGWIRLYFAHFRRKRFSLLASSQSIFFQKKFTRAIKLPFAKCQNRNMSLSFQVCDPGRYEISFVAFCSTGTFIGTCAGITCGGESGKLFDKFVGKHDHTWGLNLYTGWSDGIHRLHADKGDVYFKHPVLSNGDLFTMILEKDTDGKKEDPGWRLSFQVNGVDLGTCFDGICKGVSTCSLTPCFTFSSSNQVLQVIEVLNHKEKATFNRRAWIKFIEKNYCNM